MKCFRKNIKDKVLSKVIAVFISLCSFFVYADEGGISFWVPGYFGSLAAAPLQPGFSLATIYYHSTLEGGREIAFARQVIREKIRTSLIGNIDINLKADVDSLFVIPSYTFNQTFLNGQATLAMAIPYGRSQASVDATIRGNLGFNSGFIISKGRTDVVTDVGDLAPMFNLRWNQGSNNYMVYVAGNILTGAYDANRLANLGVNHPSVDVGSGYTYLNMEAGHEFSAVLGITYNFENKRTQYKNGTDLHIDVSASTFLAKQKQLGLVGYAYQQLTCDTGNLNFVGCFKSRVFGLGPQVGYIIPLSHTQLFLNIKGYKEFAAENRTHGWNTWLTLSLTPTGTKKG